MDLCLASPAETCRALPRGNGRTSSSPVWGWPQQETPAARQGGERRRPESPFPPSSGQPEWVAHPDSRVCSKRHRHTRWHRRWGRRVANPWPRRGGHPRATKGSPCAKPRHLGKNHGPTRKRSCPLRNLRAGIELPRHAREAVTLFLANPVCVLRIETHQPVLIHNLRMKTANHVFFELDLGVCANRGMFDHGQADRMAGEMAQCEARALEHIGSSFVNFACQNTVVHF